MARHIADLKNPPFGLCGETLNEHKFHKQGICDECLLLANRHGLDLMGNRITKENPIQGSLRSVAKRKSPNSQNVPA